MYSEKDFFGDPLWPTDFDPEKGRLSKHSQSQLMPNNKHSINQERSQTQMVPDGLPNFQQESSDFERTFLQSEQKMQYSNLKHSEVTYLDDSQKNQLFYDEDQNLPLKPDQKEGKQEFESRIQQILVKFQQEEPFSDHQSENSSSDESYLPDQILSTINEYIVQKKNRKTKILEYRKLTARAKRAEGLLLKKQKQIIEQLLDENCLMEDNQKRTKMLKVENQIIRKLKLQEDQIKEKEQSNDNITKKTIKPIKTQKYKILTQSEKQYLVFLSTLSTTCEVSRRFSISVNNICRWKKGCARKVGAGRKITNQNLEEKVIQYVKNLVRKGELLTRKKVQLKAKQLSQDENFKASKGWFERFYTRNIDIFPPQQTEANYWKEK